MKKIFTFKVLLTFFCLLLIGVGLDYIARGFTHSLYDHHVFRQSQTAMSILGILEGGPWFSYETAVFGAPWSIPMEFPLYQIFSAGLSLVFSLGIEESGRSVGIVAYLFSLLGLWQLFRVWGFSKTQSLIAPALLAVSPTALYWSRTVMIESTAFAFGIYYLIAVSKGVLSKESKLLLFCAAIFGTLAALTKITTFGLFCIFAAGIVIQNHFLHYGFKLNFKLALKQKNSLLFFAMIPVGIGYAWTKYADYIKTKNVFADGFITSSALHDWNFGTWNQLLSFDTWKRFADVQFSLALGSTFSFGLFLTALFFVKKNKFLAVWATFCYLLAFSIFTNLYFVHDYYGAGNVVLIVIAASLVLASLAQEDSLRSKTLSVVGIVVIGGLSYSKYKAVYYPMVRSNNQFYTHDLGAKIREKVASDEVILVYGADWDASIPFGAKRRAIMDRWNLSLESPKMKKTISMTGKDKIKGMVACHGMQANSEFLSDKIVYFGLNPKPEVIGPCAVFGSNSQKETTSRAL